MDVRFMSKTLSTKYATDYKNKLYVKKEKYPGLLIMFSKNEKVNDEVRGVLVYGGNDWFFISVPQYIALKSTKSLKRIGLLLESPHKDEYLNNQPISPANGVTGQKIESLISQRMKSDWQIKLQSVPTITQYDYEVVLINAVQYQTSCYKILGEQWDHTNRNHVFRLLFNNFQLKSDLIGRLNSYKLDIIVNCITSNLKNEVSFINQLNGVQHIVDIHPSAWK